jgi:hypothetical protein
MNGVAMNTFTIDSDNNITAHAGLAADADKSLSFTSQNDLAKLTTAWPISRLVETWNSFAGVAPFADLKPVKNFSDRKAGVARTGQPSNAWSPSFPRSRHRRNLSQPLRPPPIGIEPAFPVFHPLLRVGNETARVRHAFRA